MINFPPVSAFLDYLVVYVYKKISNSTIPFYNTLFIEGEISKDSEEKDADKEKMKFLYINTMYEKFCYVN